jgi:putative MATE family efflux protein
MAGPPTSRPLDRSIVEGPISAAVWNLAWPTVLQNALGGLQGVVDHALVGHLVGYTGNAAIGVALQIFIVVIVFVMSLFTGMSVLVARAAGAGDGDRVNHLVYQATLAAIALSVGVLAPIGWFVSPTLLALVNATAEVRAAALPYLRILFVCGVGWMSFFLFGAALRSAGDAKTPLRMGIILTVSNVVLNVLFIRGWGPVPALGVAGAAVGTVLAGFLATGFAVTRLLAGKLVVRWPATMPRRPDLATIRALFRVGLPTGVQGIAMNVAGVMLLRFIGSLDASAHAQAAYSVGYTELFSLITWTSVGLMGAVSAVVGQNLGARQADRAVAAVAVTTKIGLAIAAGVGILFLAIPGPLVGLFGLDDPIGRGLATQLLAVLSLSGLFVTVALIHTGALQGAGDTKSPLYISLISQIGVPLGLCFAFDRLVGLEPWHVGLAILFGHATRASLSVLRFRQGLWREA